MTDREAQIEALWTYEISKEKILKRLVKKGLMTQAEEDELSERVFEQLDTYPVSADVGENPQPQVSRGCL